MTANACTAMASFPLAITQLIDPLINGPFGPMNLKQATPWTKHSPQRRISCPPTELSRLALATAGDGTHQAKTGQHHGIGLGLGYRGGHRDVIQ